jgi:hypothetical protein
VLLATGDCVGAQTSYREAIVIAQQQSAKLWELRAATSLARLWRDRGKRIEARDLLAPVYGWFTEGFGTSVLQEAKALLDQLTGDRSPGMGEALRPRLPAVETPSTIHREVARFRRPNSPAPAQFGISFLLPRRAAPVQGAVSRPS